MHIKCRSKNVYAYLHNLCVYVCGCLGCCFDVGLPQLWGQSQRKGGPPLFLFSFSFYFICLPVFSFSLIFSPFPVLSFPCLSFSCVSCPLFSFSFLSTLCFIFCCHFSSFLSLHSSPFHFLCFHFLYCLSFSSIRLPLLSFHFLSPSSFPSSQYFSFAFLYLFSFHFLFLSPYFLPFIIHITFPSSSLSLSYPPCT